MHIGTKVGEFTFSQRKKLSPQIEIEEIIQGDILSEVKVYQSNINDNFKKFTQKYGIKTDVGAHKKKTDGTASQVDDILAKFSQQLKQAVETTGFSLEST